MIAAGTNLRPAALGGRSRGTRIASVRGHPCPVLTKKTTPARLQALVPSATQDDGVHSTTSTEASATNNAVDAPSAKGAVDAAQGAAAAVAEAASNGSSSSSEASSSEPSHLQWVPDASSLAELQYAAPSGQDKFWTSLKLAFALPWRRFKNESVLTIKLEGAIADQLQGRFSSTLSVPQICDALEKAALDPRIVGVAVEISPLQVGWAKLMEIRRYVELFRQSGKFSIAYMKLAGEKEYYLATAFEKVYIPPSANIRLAGFTVAGTFLRGVLDKVGVEPQVRRIGEFKSAGDQLLRRDMSEAQRVQLSELLDDIYDHFVEMVAAARGKTQQEVKDLLDQGVYDMKQLEDGGWVTALKYEDEILEELKGLTGGKDDEVRKVSIRKYSKVGRSAFNLNGKKRIAVLRASGAILGQASGTGESITPDALIPKLRALAKDKNTAAVVLRVDSPGGDALASDLMWREIRQLAAKKPVVACMGDVAASGGYYMSMGAQAIVAQPLTLTGSIGVVTGKLNLAELYAKVGYNKQLLSRGRFAEFLAADNRPFNQEESALFDESAQFAYESFRNKAAESRNMPVEDMQAVAQGRVWSGQRAVTNKLVDVLGGLWEAVALAKQAAGIPQEDKVTLVEVSRASTSPLTLLRGAGASALLFAAAVQALSSGMTVEAAAQQLVGVAALQLPLMAGVDASTGLQLLQQAAAGQPLCLLTDVDAASLAGSSGSSSLSSSTWGGSSSSSSKDGWLAEAEDAGPALMAAQAFEDVLLELW